MIGNVCPALTHTPVDPQDHEPVMIDSKMAFIWATRTVRLGPYQTLTGYVCRYCSCVYVVGSRWTG